MDPAPAKSASATPAESVASMTGYAEAAGTAAGWRATVRLRSVNHRYLDLRWQAPLEIDAWIATAERRLRTRLRRGHLDIRVALDHATDSALQLDAARVEAYLRAHVELSRRLGQSQAPEVAEILRVPGMLASADVTQDETWPPLLDDLLERALARLEAERRREGAALAADLRARAAVMATHCAAVLAQRAAVEDAMRDRLQRRMREMVGSSVSPERVLQEAALLAERGDISEELTRIAAHLEQLSRILEGGGEVGKRLDFLLQELNREVNTLLSKSSGAGDIGLAIATHGLAMKAEVEKLREQSQNLE